ncbi:MAG: hypothetical protein PHV34_03495 [Verrucomicrobiae bacterium]|nr:hypothetical protein [Verrucomicrobiae bacterium]
MIKWKMTWAWTLPCLTEADVESGVQKAVELGFNAMEWSQAQSKFPTLFTALCKKAGIESYYCVNPSSKARQKFLDPEYALQENPHCGGEPPSANDIGKVISRKQPGCCFVQPDCLENTKKTMAKAFQDGFDGIAFDFFGYDNFHGCYCPLCNELREKYITSHPGMERQEADHRFSEDMIVKFHVDAVAYARSIKADAKTTCHIYPSFYPNLLYGNRLPVDYCGQTVAWFFKPHWPLEKIKKYSDIVVREEALYHPNSKGSPFIGFYCKDKFKDDVRSAERIREEIQIIKSSGAQGIQMVEMGHILADPGVSKVIAQELGGKPEAFSK